MENTTTITTVSLQWPKAFFARWLWRALRVEGRDKEKFLSGIVTNTIKELQAGDINDSLALTVKGRMITEILVAREEDAFLLWVDPNEEDALWGHVEHYHVIEDIAFGWSDRVMYLLGGSEINQHFEEMGFAAPEVGKGSRWQTTDGRFALWVSRFARFEAPPLWVAWGSQEAAHAFQETLQSRGCSDLSASSEALAFSISWYNTTDELKDLLIHEAGLEHTHVSFKKGCFIGQEVVARTHWRGKANKGLFLLGSDTPLGSAISKGALVFNQEQQEVGQIRRCQTLLNGQEAFRALLRLKSTEEQDSFHTILPDGSTVPLQRLELHIA